jgi:hypothetical protein
MNGAANCNMSNGQNAANLPRRRGPYSEKPLIPALVAQYWPMLHVFCHAGPQFYLLTL